MISHKRGATFSYTFEYEADLGDPANLSLYTIKSQIRDINDALVSEVVITLLDGDMQAVFSVEDTSVWPLGNLYWDISFDYDSNISYTETITINVVRGITQWPPSE